jgi:hypothetical protein
VVHQSGSQSRAIHSARGYGLLDVGDEPGRMFRPAGQLPSEEVTKSARLRSVRIVETLSVKVLRKSNVACTVVHKSLFIYTQAASLMLMSVSHDAQRAGHTEIPPHGCGAPFLIVNIR